MSIMCKMLSAIEGGALLWTQSRYAPATGDALADIDRVNLALTLATPRAILHDIDLCMLPQFIIAMSSEGAIDCPAQAGLIVAAVVLTAVERVVLSVVIAESAVLKVDAGA